MSETNQHTEIFRQEADELLSEIEQTVLEIEQNPEDIEAVNRLFRAMHTIKGSGAMFGFDDISDFTHHVETILDQVRSGNIPVTKKLIDLILSSRDHINAILYASIEGVSLDNAAGENIISELKILKSESTSPPPTETEKETEVPDEDEYVETTYRIRFKPDRTIYSTGIDPAILVEDLRSFGECMIVAQTNDVPCLEDLDPELSYLSWDIVLTTRKGINAIKDVFIFVEDHAGITVDIIDEENPLLEEESYKKIGEILVEKDDISTEDLKAVLNEQKRVGELLVEEDIAHPDAVDSALIEQQHVKKVREQRRKVSVATSVRVPAIKLDALVDLVGEMVTAQARLSQKADRANDPELISISEEIEHLVGGLRDNTMSIRMLPIGTTFSNFKRLVRDLSKDLGKEIVLTTEGGETELDKTVIERLNDPMVHIIRNSIDHGIETPDMRQASHKSAQGTIHLEAEHSGAHVLIRISDDGKGLDLEVIRERAVEKGIIPAEAILSDKELYQFIFHPGFSTAEKVTDVSGRGVGMDVVKRNIDALRGSVEIESKKEKGTTIILKLPLTLAIIDGLMVMIGKDYYILPLSSVEECVELNREETEKIKGRNILNVRGEAVPYIRLREEFEICNGKPDIEHIVITEVNGERVGFVVDTVIGGHQTVIKSLGPAFKQAKDVSGATILGDGTVALILDVHKLV